MHLRLRILALGCFSILTGIAQTSQATDRHANLSSGELYQRIKAIVEAENPHGSRIEFSIDNCSVLYTSEYKDPDCSVGKPYTGAGTRFELDKLMTRPDLVKRWDKDGRYFASWSFEPITAGKLRKAQQTMWSIVKEFYKTKAPIEERTTKLTQRAFSGEFGSTVLKHHNFHTRCDGQPQIWNLIGESVTLSFPKDQVEESISLLSAYAKRECPLSLDLQ
ncbi:MAG: hypothetical protein AAF557_27825 [Pseudomonadota bacterium]